ncbi:hypothetical protein PR202_gb28792 [Eleusine coracana subsp. coracana]|uniref:DAGKc domain-containing protein n=1 Tax=Eleusine coracana subsp. coracana TaxID=191504 RepID=A0AAV5FYM7_ELECO|nr:hypothetical protein PR202_gb28792 [Eleusine coracana subsp. coracana]
MSSRSLVRSPLSGFTMEVIETAYAGHAKTIASTIDLSKFPDGIICVGGDGIVNEVLNGLLGRDNWNEAIKLPIGIIPAGSDNSLVWTVLGIRDPVSAANAVTKGGSTPIDVFAVKRSQAGFTHFGLTASYFGFVADVVQLSEDFRLQFGPFRYVVAGFLKFLSLPKYKFEVEYLPSSPGRGLELKPLTEDNWITRKGEFLGIFSCNHFCKPAQGLLSPIIAPKAQHNDGNLDLILVHGSGRLRLFLLLHCLSALLASFITFCGICQGISGLSYFHMLLFAKTLITESWPLQQVQVKQVKIRPLGNTHNGCGVDGELLRAEDQTEWQCSLLPAQGRLLGQHPRASN